MRLVVIGAQAAGLAAASEARRVDPGLEILVLEKGSRISYGACGLPYVVEGQVQSFDQLRVYTPEYFARERRIAIRTGAAVTAIAHPRREVVLGSGERVPYDKLILTLGTRRKLPDAPNVFAMDSWEQVEQLRAELASGRPRRAAVIGAGYVGLEAAGALRTQGLAVSVYESSADVLQRADPWLTQAVTAHLERFGIAVHRHWRGDLPEAGLIVYAAGLLPQTALAADAGVALGATGAIAVTSRGETNLGGVYAAGDCAEVRHRITGRAVWMPLGTTARKTGQIAGGAAAGARAEFGGIVGTSIVRVCGLSVATTGFSPAQARQEGLQPVGVEIRAPDKAAYFGGRPLAVQLVADRKSGHLIGGAIVGEQGVHGRINVLATALTAGMTPEDLAQLDLAYAPADSTVTGPLQIAARQLAKLLH